MMTIMRMRSAILTIAYCISAIFQASGISDEFGKIYCRANRREKGRGMADPALVSRMKWLIKSS